MSCGSGCCLCCFFSYVWLALGRLGLMPSSPCSSGSEKTREDEMETGRIHRKRLGQLLVGRCHDRLFGAWGSRARGGGRRIGRGKRQRSVGGGRGAVGVAGGVLDVSRARNNHQRLAGRQAGFAQQESEARRWSALAGCWGVGRRPRVRPVLCRVTITGWLRGQLGQPERPRNGDPSPLKAQVIRSSKSSVSAADPVPPALALVLRTALTGPCKYPAPELVCH